MSARQAQAARCLEDYARRISSEAAPDRFALRDELIASITEIGLLRDLVANRLSNGGTWNADLARIDVALRILERAARNLRSQQTSTSTEDRASRRASTRDRTGLAIIDLARRAAAFVSAIATGTMAMGVGSSAFAQVSTTPTYVGMTPEDVGVMQRPRPEYDAKGIPMGGFRLFPTLDLAASYDDNVFRLPFATSDYYFEEAPSLRLQSQWGRHFFEVYGGVDNFNYAKFSRLNLMDWNVGSDGRLDISRAAIFSAAGSYGEYHENLNSPNTVGFQASPNRYYKGHFEASGAYQPNRLGIGLGASYDRYDWQSTPILGGGTLFNTDRNESEYQGYAKLNYDFSPGYSAFLKGLFDDRHFDHFFDRSGLHRSSTGYRVNAGLDMQLSHLVAGEVFLGYLVQNYAKNVPIPLKSISGLDYGINLDWFATPLLTLHLTGARQISDVTLAGISASDDKFIKLSADYEFRRNVIIQGYVSYTDSHYVGSTRSDNWTGAGVTARYLMNRYISADLNYNFNDRSSNFAGFNFTDNTVSLGLTLHV